MKALITGPQTPHGEVRVSGAKNSATRVLAAALLGEGAITLRNFPTELEDVKAKVSFIRRQSADRPHADRELIKVIPELYRRAKMENRVLKGYTTGVFDCLHVGHVNLLRNARALCDKLIVGVASDALCLERKKLVPIQSQDDRMEVIRSIRFVDDAIIQHKFDNVADHGSIGFDILFKGDDWKGHPEWIALEEVMSARGVRILFLPYTAGVSSTIIRRAYRS